jgi:hypothetical protein
MTPIKIVASYVSYAAQTIFFFIGTAGNPAVPAYPTLINADPIISINGQADTVQGPFYSSKQHRLPWVAYQLSKPVTAQDVVTWTTPAGWCAVGAKTCEVDAGKADNWAGRLEPGIFGYMGFNDPTKTLKVGLGPAPIQGSTCGLKDVIHRADNPWQGALTSTADGYPLTINGTARTGLWDVRTATGFENGQNPTPKGMWIITADETNPVSPMRVTLSTLIPTLASYQPIITPGVLSGGVEYGKQWAFNITNPQLRNLALCLNLTRPDGKPGANTLKNLHAFDPGNAPAINPGLSVNDNTLRMQSSSIPGIYTPITRNLSGWQSAEVNDSDLPGPRFSYARMRPSKTWTTDDPGSTGNRVIPISAVRKYDLGASPYVYGTAPFKRFSPSSVPGLAYQVKIADLGLGFDWMKPPAAGTTRNIIVEFVTSVPHNLQSGQPVSLSKMTFNVANDAGGGAMTTGGTAMIWVTGPTTFVGSLSAANIAAGHYGWVDDSNGPQAVTGTASVSPNAGGIPFEFMGANSRAMNGSAIWFGINHCMSDEAVRAIAQRVYNSTDRGTRIYVQYSNEILIPSFVWGWLQQLANLEGLTLEQADIQRTSEVHKIFTEVWSNDASSIVRVYQPFTVAENTLQNGLTYANANRIPIDVIAIAPYINMDASPPFVQAAAAICADDARSIAFGKPLMPMAAYHDFVRHFLKYNNYWSGRLGKIGLNQIAITRSGYGMGADFIYPRPKLCFYECALSTAIPSGVSAIDASVRTGLTHDFIYHPNYYLTIQAFLQFCQNPGPGVIGADAAIITSTVGGRSSAGGPDGAFAAIWCTYNHQMSQRGDGRSNKFWATALGGDGASGHDVTNVSVSGHAYADWIAGAAARRN